MEFDISILEQEGIDTKEGIEYTNGNDRYLSALWRYYRAYEDNIRRIQTAMESNTYDDYSIVVHSIKSNSKMIGAHDVSCLFAELERAALEGDIDVINKKTEPALTEYKKIIDLLRPLGVQEKVSAAGELSTEEATEITEKLLEALDDFNEELSEALINKLSGYPFGLTQKNRLKEAMTNLHNFNYDAAAEIIRELSASIS